MPFHTGVESKGRGGGLGARVRDLPGDSATISEAIRAPKPRTGERAFRSRAGLVPGGPVTIGFPLVCGARVGRPCNHRVSACVRGSCREAL
eukprot:349674-Chlamydomonas_euryale.AAC.3